VWPNKGLEFGGLEKQAFQQAGTNVYGIWMGMLGGRKGQLEGGHGIKSRLKPTQTWEEGKNKDHTQKNPPGTPKKKKTKHSSPGPASKTINNIHKTHH